MIGLVVVNVVNTLYLQCSLEIGCTQEKQNVWFFLLLSFISLIKYYRWEVHEFQVKINSWSLKTKEYQFTIEKYYKYNGFKRRRLRVFLSSEVTHNFRVSYSGLCIGVSCEKDSAVYQLYELPLRNSTSFTKIG